MFVPHHARSKTSFVEPAGSPPSQGRSTDSGAAGGGASQDMGMFMSWPDMKVGERSLRLSRTLKNVPSPCF